MKIVNSAKKAIPIEEKVAEYDRLREQSALIKKRMDALAKEIKDFASKNGVKNDSGSYYCEDDHFLYGSQARKSVKFISDKAIDFFKTHSLNKAIKITEVIDEDAVEEYVSSGDITFEDLESITETKVSYAIDIKKKEDMPVVEQTTVSSAASRKPKIIKKGKK